MIELARDPPVSAAVMDGAPVPAATPATTAAAASGRGAGPAPGLDAQAPPAASLAVGRAESRAESLAERLAGRLEQAGAIDFCTALSVHAQVMAGLREHVYGARGAELGDIGEAELCPLGHWLAGIAAPLRRLPEYEAVRLAHALFHVRAALVVAMVRSGRLRDAAAQVETGGSLRRRSIALVRAIGALRRKIAPALPPPAPMRAPGRPR